MRRLPTTVIYLVAFLFAAQALRSYVVGRLTAHARAQARSSSVAVWRAQADLPARLAPEASEAPALRGQALLLLARASDPQVGRLVAELALRDLGEAIVANSADASLWLAAAMAANLAEQPLTAQALVEEAVLRATHAPEYAWVKARLQTDPEARRIAYRRVTKLRPEAVPAVLAEAIPGAPARTQAAYVAPNAAAYRAWAWSVSGETGMAIARQGLAYADAGGRASRGDAGWLAYYLALHTAASQPEASLRWYRQALNDIPNEQAVHRNYGFALLHTGRPAEAARAFGESIRLHGDLANAAHLGLAEAWMSTGRQGDALQVLQRLTKHARLEAWVRREAGDALYRLEHAP